jgi:Na+/citrate or Na+/malate symporter
MVEDVGVAVDVAVGVSVDVIVGVAVDVAVGVSVDVIVGVIVGVAVGVSVDVIVGVAVDVAVGVSVDVIVGVGVGVGQTPLQSKLQSKVSLSGVVGLAGPASTKTYLPVKELKHMLSVPLVVVFKDKPQGPG